MLAYLKAIGRFIDNRKIKFKSPFLFSPIQIPFRHFLEIEKTIRKKRLYQEAADVYREAEIQRFIKIYYELLRKSLNPDTPMHKFAEPKAFEGIFELSDRELIESYLDEKLRYDYFYPSNMRIDMKWIETYGSYFVKFLGRLIEERGLGNEVCFSYIKLD